MFDDITEKHREIEKIVLKNAHKSYLYTKFICVIIKQVKQMKRALNNGVY